MIEPGLLMKLSCSGRGKLDDVVFRKTVCPVYVDSNTQDVVWGDFQSPSRSGQRRAVKVPLAATWDLAGLVVAQLLSWIVLCWLLASPVVCSATKRVQLICKQHFTGQTQSVRYGWNLWEFQIQWISKGPCSQRKNSRCRLWLWCSQLATSGHLLALWDRPNGTKEPEHRVQVRFYWFARGREAAAFRLNAARNPCSLWSPFVSGGTHRVFPVNGGSVCNRYA